MCWLPSIEQHHRQEQLPLAAYFGTAGSVPGSAVVYQVWYSGSLQPDLYQRRRWVENRVSNKVWTLQVPSNAFRFDERTSNVPGFYQQCIARVLGPVCSCVPWQHTDLLQNKRATHTTCLQGPTSTAGCKLASKAWKESFPLQRSPFPRLHCNARRVTDGPWEDTICGWVASTKERQGGPVFPWVCKLL